MITHVPGLFSRPQQEWKTIRDSEKRITLLYTFHFLLLAAIPPLCMFIGTTRVGWSLAGGAPALLTPVSAAVMSLLMYLAILTGVVIMGAFINWMARTFQSKPGLARSIIFAAYTATPMFVAGLMALYPNVLLFMLVGVAAVAYTVYLLYTGVPIFMKVSKEKGFGFASSILTVGLVMLVALLAITVIIWSMGFGPAHAW